ncbi:cytochrome P450 [Actinopolymorpha pittospori]|uniref:Pentalenolactone synthase n=1 Tax=Actinopolymorpha pittospori TaxID=648752 RepID=A0A927N5L7_9ACTN|nr:cytochrome P450 [Actinopolymorpha pittospori]MBE1612534.1 pentalenolactone synthase [Actinopolymorpha pittospori]
MSSKPDITQITTAAGDPAWLVTGYDAVRSLFADSRLGRSHPRPDEAPRLFETALVGSPSGTFETEHADHLRMRRALSKAFSARRMEALRPRVQVLVDSLLDDLLERTPPVDFHEAFSFPLPALVISELLGVPTQDRDRFRVWSEDMAHRTDRAKADAGLQSLLTYLDDLVKVKRRQQAQDVISDLVAAADQTGELTQKEIVGFSMLLLFAGHVTTATALEKGIMLLDLHPEQRAALWGDPDLAAGAVEEILRAPFPIPETTTTRSGSAGTPRYARADIACTEQTIRAGDLVVLARGAANQDDRVFTEPNRFDVRREDNPHLAFGHGPHYCLGAPLARIELQVAFATIPRRVPTLRLAVPAAEIERRTDLVIGALTELPVTW